MMISKKAIVNIRNCMFGINCDANWDEMKIVDHKDDTNSEIRFCNHCQREVHECNDDNELAQNIRLNRCVRFYDEEYNIHPLMGEYMVEDIK